MEEHPCSRPASSLPPIKKKHTAFTPDREPILDERLLHNDAHSLENKGRGVTILAWLLALAALIYGIVNASEVCICAAAILLIQGLAAKR